MKKLLTILATCLVVAGCLIEETTHTIYIEPDGAVTWTVSQAAVRSDKFSRAERAAEEREFVEAVRAGEHGVALALDRLAPQRLESRVERDARPYSVVTVARFARIDDLARRFLDLAGANGTVELRHEGDLVHFVMTCESEGSAESGDEDLLLELVGDADDYRLMLSRGRFVEARGFEVSQDGAVAVPQAIDEDETKRNGGLLTWSLTWTVERDS